MLPFETTLNDVLCSQLDVYIFGNQNNSKLLFEARKSCVSIHILSMGIYALFDVSYTMTNVYFLLNSFFKAVLDRPEGVYYPQFFTISPFYDILAQWIFATFFVWFRNIKRSFYES